MTHNLVSHFASAGLDLRLASSPFTSGSNLSSIFMLDIRRERPHDVRSEHFLGWLGGQSKNLAAVQGLDRRERQLVLCVREGENEFEESIPRWMLKNLPGVAGSMEWKKALAARAGVGADIVVARSGGASIVRSTRGSTRHMLVGRDERQLFMCELPRPCTSVKQAHDALRTPAARSRSRSALDQPIRQGEWFFVRVTDAESDDLERAVGGARKPRTNGAAWGAQARPKSRIVVHRKVSINSIIPRAGKPHIADEIGVAVGTPRDLRVYARGAIRHADHKTIQLHQWRRVLRNLEVDQGRSPLGGTWID